MTGNTLTGSAGRHTPGRRDLTVGFPTTLTDSVVAFNSPTSATAADPCDQTNATGHERAQRSDA